MNKSKTSRFQFSSTMSFNIFREHHKRRSRRKTATVMAEHSEIHSSTKEKTVRRAIRAVTEIRAKPSSVSRSELESFELDICMRQFFRGSLFADRSITDMAQTWGGRKLKDCHVSVADFLLFVSFFHFRGHFLWVVFWSIKWFLNGKFMRRKIFWNFISFLKHFFNFYEFRDATTIF